eukprot:TRINITY_DN6565_c0_g3_i1.p1 TRINITY_DN6565_c0_g3~~TRINITY_DN6565_c0_g3_i1.p1  ORF type:complete len:1622 (+),score=204.33 TRINITY_DN6565_c0_g3_i1:56-4867(+)
MDAICLAPRQRRTEAVLVVAKHLKQHIKFYTSYLRGLIFDRDLKTYQLVIQHFGLKPANFVPRNMFDLLGDERCDPTSIQALIDSVGGDAALAFSGSAAEGHWPTICRNLEAYLRVMDPIDKGQISRVLEKVKTPEDVVCIIPLLQLGASASPAIRAVLKNKIYDMLPLVLRYADVNATLDESTGDTLLHRACRASDSALFRLLFESSTAIDVKRPNNIGDTALHVLLGQRNPHAWQDVVHCVRTLIFRGADASQPNSAGKHPIDLLLANPNAAVISALEQFGIHVVADDFGKKLIEALQLGRGDAALSMLRFDPSMLDPSYRNPIGDSVLHIAVRLRHVELTSRILALAPELANALNTEGWTPLHLAMNSFGPDRIEDGEQIRLCKDLLFGGARLDLEEGCCHPLSFAAMNPQPELFSIVLEWHEKYPDRAFSSERHAKEYSGLLVSALEIQHFTGRKVTREIVSAIMRLPGVDVNARTAYTSMTPLMFVAMLCPEAVQLLLDAGASSAINYYDSFGLTALMYACWKGDRACLSALISAGADIHALCKPSALQNSPHGFYRPDVFSGGQPVIFFAVFHQNLYAVLLLMEAGVDLSAKDSSGRWLGDFAVDILNGEKDDWGRFQNFLTDLINRGARWYISDVSCALYRINEAILDRSQECRLVACVLESALDSCYLGGRNVFLHFARYRRLLTKSCLARHSNLLASCINDVDENGMSILHYACQYSHNEGVLPALLSIGADPSLVNCEGFTPVHLIGFNDDCPRDVPSFLESAMKRRSDPFWWSVPPTASAIPLTPLMVACQHGHEKAIEYLLALKNLDPDVTDKTGKTALGYLLDCTEQSRFRDGRALVELASRFKRLPRDMFARKSIKWPDAAAFVKLMKLGADPTVTNPYRNHLLVHFMKRGTYGFDVREFVTTCSMGSLVNQESYNGETPLLASINDTSSNPPLLFFRALIMLKADPNKANRFGEFPLLRACGNYAQGAVIASELIKAGARPDVKVPARLSLIGVSDPWLIHCIRWAEWDPLPILRQLESIGVKLASIVSESSNLLHVAASAKYDRSETIGYLVSSAGVPINALDKRGMSPLQIAMESTHGLLSSENVVSLLDNGANAELLQESSFSPDAGWHFIGAHPLLTRAAVRLFEKSEKREGIFNTARASPRDNTRHGHPVVTTPLLSAVGAKIVESVEMLLSCDWIDVNCRGDNGITPLMHCQDEQVFKLLLSSPRIELSLRNSEGHDVFGVHRYSENLIRLLLHHPAARDATGKLRADLQAEHTLCKHAPASNPLFETFVTGAQKKHLNEAVLVVIEGHHDEAACTALVENGADLHYVNVYNENALYAASSKRQNVPYLLRNGAFCVGASTRTGLSPVGQAAVNEKNTALISILKHGYKGSMDDLRAELMTIWNKIKPSTANVLANYFGLDMPSRAVAHADIKEPHAWESIKKLPVPAGFASHYAYCLSKGNVQALRAAIRSAQDLASRDALLNGIHVTDNGPLTTLHVFVAAFDLDNYGSKKAFGWLLKQPDLKFNQACDCYGFKGITPWHLAVQNGRVETVEALLCTPPVDLLAVDALGRDALAIAKENYSSHPRVLQILLAHSSFRSNQ